MLYVKIFGCLTDEQQSNPVSNIQQCIITINKLHKDLTCEDNCGLLTNVEISALSVITISLIHFLVAYSRGQLAMGTRRLGTFN